MPVPDRGTKRHCAGCGASFYDLRRSPIICPKCATPYVAPPQPVRHGTAPRRAAPPIPEEIETVNEEAEEEAEEAEEETSPEDEEEGEGDEIEPEEE